MRVVSSAKYVCQWHERHDREWFVECIIHYYKHDDDNTEEKNRFCLFSEKMHNRGVE